MRTNRRRRILRTLLDRSATSERELVRALARNERNVPAADVPSETVQALRTNLTHVQLPLLEDCDLIRWNRANGTIATTDHAAFGDERFRRLLETDGDGVDEALSGLSDGRRRHLIAVLRNSRTPMSRTALAREILRRERGETEFDTVAITEIGSALAHVHLPKLADADFIDYDPETDRVTYASHPGLENVITLLQRPTNRFVERLDEFLGGLLTTYTNASGPTDDPFDWPSAWSDPNHG
ncbi:hypothetical protein [Haladaptatus sp. CMAA 1911]|uniref:DUF7344 domain-containing protein n=1 Tax=unclassified Haladaptatus TaxID=2622732 RepID=UPI0037552070